jgi:hypothetical protein
MLRSERRERLEAWAMSTCVWPTLRDAALWAAPQGEMILSRPKRLYPACSGVLNVSLKARMARKEIAAAAMIMKAGL